MFLYNILTGQAIEFSSAEDLKEYLEKELDKNNAKYKEFYIAKDGKRKSW